MKKEVPEGLKVKYYHTRAYGDDHFTILPRGGETEAVIFLGDEEIVRGVAVCNPIDNYRKSIGRDISLGRALKALEDGQLSDVP